jgi:hypothetical protein
MMNVKILIDKIHDREYKTGTGKRGEWKLASFSGICNGQRGEYVAFDDSPLHIEEGETYEGTVEEKYGKITFTISGIVQKEGNTETPDTKDKTETISKTTISKTAIDDERLRWKDPIYLMRCDMTEALELAIKNKSVTQQGIEDTIKEAEKILDWLGMDWRKVYDGRKKDGNTDTETTEYPF